MYFWLNEPDISRKMKIVSDYVDNINSFHGRLEIWKSIFAAGFAIDNNSFLDAFGFK